jgi:hypothetical protein
MSRVTHANSSHHDRQLSLTGDGARPDARHRRRQFITIAGSAACAVLLGAARPTGERDQPPATVVGLRYDIQMTATNTPAPGPSGQSSPTYLQTLAHAQMASGTLRIDVAKGPFVIGVVQDGDFLTLRDSGHTVLLFKPQTKQYLQLDLAKLSQGVSGLAGTFGGLLGMQATNVKITTASLGAGDLMQQYSTVKYRLTQDYTVAVAVMGMNTTMTTHSTSDYWFAPQVTNVANPFDASPNKGSPTSFLGPDYATQMAAARAKLPNGVPLKAVTTTVVTDSKGTSTSTTTWQLSNITKATISTSVFDVPAGYTQMQGSPMSLLPAMAGVGAIGAMSGASTTPPGGTAAPTGTTATPAWNGSSAPSAGATGGIPNAGTQGAGVPAANGVQDSGVSAAASAVKKLLHLP